VVVTIRDVAREAGVGLGTASRALAHEPGVAATTRARVLAAAERLGYRRSPIAHAFSRRRTNTLEIIVPRFTRFYMEILRGVESALADTDYSVVIRTIERREARERVLAACCTRGRSDGVLFISILPPDDLVERLLGMGLPAVLIDGEHPQLTSIRADDEQAEMAVVRHCVELGHHQIALLDRAEDPFGPAVPSGRQRGFERAMAEAGLEISDGYVQVIPFGLEGGARGFERLAALPEPPTAVLTGADMQAMGVIEAARRHGWKVPEDLSVVGCHDIELAEHLGLTTVRVPVRDLGQLGAGLLLAAIGQSAAPPQRISLPAELVVRATCGPPTR
jgi:DNA-binding LacI/PurR family transcriptional regulator